MNRVVRFAALAMLGGLASCSSDDGGTPTTPVTPDAGTIADTGGTPGTDTGGTPGGDVGVDAGGTSGGPPPVSVPQLGSLGELVPAYEQSVTTWTQAQTDLFAAYQTFAEADPAIDDAAFVTAADAFGAACRSWVTASQTLEAYGQQFSGAPRVIPDQAILDMWNLQANLAAGVQGKADDGNVVTHVSTWKQTLLNFTGNSLAAGATVGTFVKLGGVAAVQGLATLGTAGVGALVLPVGGAIVAGVTVKVIWSYCTGPSSSPGKADAIGQGACVLGSIQGQPGDLLPVPPGATVVIDVPGKEPIFIDNVQIAAGTASQVDVTLGDPASGTPNGPVALTPLDPAQLATCDKVFAVDARPSPADPGPGEGVTVTATTSPAIAGCAMVFSVVGTDGYTNSQTVNSDASGQGSFFIPGGEEGVVDRVTIQVGTHQTTVVYTF